MFLTSWFSRFWSRATSSFRKRVDVVQSGPGLNTARIGGGLTPEDVSAILIEADQGYMQQLVDLFDESRQRDAHLQAVTSIRETEVARLRWQVHPASDRRRDKKIAAWTSEWLRAFGSYDASAHDRDLPTLISHLQGADVYGHAAAEILCDKIEGYTIPVAAEPIHARRFIYDREGTLRLWDQDMPQSAYPGLSLLQDLPVGKVIQYQPRINGGTAGREGLLRCLVWAALFRNWGIRDWLMLAELAWKPWRIAKYDKKNTTIDDRKIAKRLQELVTTGVAVLPDVIDFTVEWASRTGGGSSGGEHLQLVTFFANEISKAVVGGTLAVDQGRVGSNALGNVHERRLYAFVDDAARRTAAILRRQLIGPFVRHNFGQDTKTPGFELVTEDAVDFQATANGFLALRRAGLRVSARDPRDRLGLSEPLEGEEILGDTTPIGAPMLALPPPDPNSIPADEAA